MIDRWRTGELQGYHVGVAHDYETCHEHKLHFREIHRRRMGWDLLFEQQLQWNDWDGEQEGGGSGTRYILTSLIFDFFGIGNIFHCNFETI